MLPYRDDHLTLPSRGCLGKSFLWRDPTAITGGAHICDDRLTLADIVAFSSVDFLGGIARLINQDNKNIVARHARMQTRPSAAAGERSV
jgi:glutathione S-transferase